MNLKEASVLITGGASGIGRHLAETLCGVAGKVFVIDQNEEQLNSLAHSYPVSVFVCDITRSESVQQTIQHIFNNHGGINVCINNAGIIHSEPLVNLIARPDKKHSFENWRKVMDVNLNGLFYVSACVAEQMIAQKKSGVIINISSISAQGNIGQSAYAASKAAVEALTKTWSKELGMFKIRTAALAPGFFDTPSTKAGINEHMLEKWKKSIPLGRLGELNHLSSAVTFIIENDYFNGKVLSLDGGLTI